MDKIKRKFKSIYQYLGLPLFIVYSLMILFLVIFIIKVFVTGGNTLYGLFFSDPNDTGMDFFNIAAMLKIGNPYDFVEFGAFYPPLCYLIIQIFAAIIPFKKDDYASGYVFSREIKASQAGLMVFIFYTVLSLIVLSYIIYKMVGKNEYEKIFLVISTLLFAPIIFTIERGNIIIFSLIFMLIFIYWYDNENKVKKEIALISLAISIVLKIYPIFFVIILLKQKKYKEMLRLLIYGIVLFFGPFLFFGGINTIGVFIKNIITGVKVTEDNIDNPERTLYRVDFTSNLKSFANSFGQSLNPIFLYISIAIIIVILVFFAFKFTDNYKIFTCLALLSTLFTPFNYYYAAIFYIIPFCLFIKARPDKKIDIAYGIMFLLLLLPFSFGEERDLFSLKVCNLAQFGMIILLIVDFIIQFAKRKSLKNEVPELE